MKEEDIEYEFIGFIDDNKNNLKKETCMDTKY